VVDVLEKTRESCHLQYWYADDKNPDRARTPGPRPSSTKQP